MSLRVLASTAIFLIAVAHVDAAATVQLELAAEQGLQITAPQEWLQRLAHTGIENVRIRGASPGDKPSLTNQGTEDHPVYHVVGILSARETLLLPGAVFQRHELVKLRDYLDRLAADGIEAVTAARGHFDLTESQLRTVQEDLAQPIAFSTKGTKLVDTIGSIREFLMHEMEPMPPSIGDSICDEEVQGLAAGTGLALLLRSQGLGLQPVKPRGEPIRYRMVTLSADGDVWPVGHEPQKSPRELAPVLFEFVNVQIDGYTLREALDAIQPRVKIPFFVDHWTLAQSGIKLDDVRPKIPQTRTYYKRVLDRALSQARLHGKLRVDEAGAPFFWITK